MHVGDPVGKAAKNRHQNQGTHTDSWIKHTFPGETPGFLLQTPPISRTSTCTCQEPSRVHVGDPVGKAAKNRHQNQGTHTDSWIKHTFPGRLLDFCCKLHRFRGLQHGHVRNPVVCISGGKLTGLQKTGTKTKKRDTDPWIKHTFPGRLLDFLLQTPPIPRSLAGGLGLGLGFLGLSSEEVGLTILLFWYR